MTAGGSRTSVALGSRTICSALNSDNRRVFTTGGQGSSLGIVWPKEPSGELLNTVCFLEVERRLSASYSAFRVPYFARMLR